MKKGTVFKSLVGNAFNFLDKAGREFESEPKYSVIHFYASLELFMKARLLQEHWTLVLSKPETGDLAKFQQGEFHSVSLDEAQRRLTSIIQQGLTDDEVKCFRELGGHRNRMVHFFHRDQATKKADIEAIVSQQCRAWYYLHRILTQRWNDVFSDYQAEIAAYDLAMRKQRMYLQARFDQLKGEIVAAEQSGATTQDCPSCGFHAFQGHESIVTPLLEFKCQVCDFTANGLEIECPECDEALILVGDPWRICGGCKAPIEPKHVMAFLASGIRVDKDDLAEGLEGNCGNCGDYHSVIRLGDHWFCTNCFDLFDHAERCGWCNELDTGDMEYSYVSGCSHCEGKAGRDSDD